MLALDAFLFMVPGVPRLMSLVIKSMALGDRGWGVERIPFLSSLTRNEAAEGAGEGGGGTARVTVGPRWFAEKVIDVVVRVTMELNSDERRCGV